MKGERLGGLLFGVAGICFLVIAWLAWKHAAPGSLGRGLLAPAPLIGAIGVCASPFLVRSNLKRVQRLPVEYRSDPSDLVAKESPHDRRGPDVGAPEDLLDDAARERCVLAFVGTPYWKSAGLGLILFGALGHVIDGFASEQAYRYLEQLQRA